MVAQRKPDSSYASNRMTRSNGPRGHLLSTFNNDASPSSDEANPKPEPKGKAPEPATDDEPQSSSDDDELPARPEFPKRMPERGPASPERPGVWSSQGRNIHARKGTLQRTSSMMTGGDEEDMLFSSQQYKRPRTKKYGPPNSFSSRAPSSSARSVPTPNKRAEKSKPRPKKGNGEKKDEKEEKENSPGFRLPPEDIDFPSTSHSSLGTGISKDTQSQALDDDSPLSSALDSGDELFQDMSKESDEASQPRKYLCPMCKEEVNPDLLIRFEAQPKQRVREQQQFCTSHKQNRAEKEWQNQGYPDINWDTFDQRVKKYFPDLEKLLAQSNSSTSYYHNILATIMKDGKAKNFRLTLSGDGVETISCGYYGTKGAAKMLQAIIDRFSASLRRLATSDNIIKTAGVAGYAQSVLVPELAMRLVRDDMGVDDDSARQILRSSIDIGHKINPAPDDEVPIPVDDD